MKFNRLYLHGFKSFVDKTVIDFPPGITAIVGPNGSGKSNVMDAVRWVFGEQNAKELRGAEMEDVVFNGSQRRKAAGFAEVGLTLSDIDEAVASKYGTFSEITITRKFYKTGEREYYINNRKCRLKDIKDIFMDTGLGARSISIIEQGKVDKIINATPDELRFFLEETAGVTKFKDKKKEAQRRLEQTKDNLDRVTDIISEILSRMDFLASQAAVLKESEDIQSKKRGLEKKYLCSIYAGKVAEQSSLNALLLEKKRDLTSKIAEYAEIVRRENLANSQYGSRTEENRSLQEKRLEAAKKAAKAESETASLKARLASSEDLKTQLEKEIEINSGILKEKEEKVSLLEEEAREAREALENVDSRIEDLSEVIEDIKAKKEEIDEEFNISDALYLEYASAAASKRNELIKAESFLSHERQTLQRLKSEKDEISSASDEAASEKERLASAMDDISTQLMQSEATLESIKKENAEIRAQADSYKIKRSELGATLKELEENAVFLKRQMEDSVAGFGEDGGLLKKFRPELLIDRLTDLPKSKLVEVGDILLFRDEYKSQVLETVSKMKSALRFAFQSDFPSIKAGLEEARVESLYDNIYSYGNVYRKIGEEDKGFKIIALKERLSEGSARASQTEKELALLSDRIYETEEKLTAKANQVEAAEKNLKKAREDYTLFRTKLDSVASEAERFLKRSNTMEKEIEVIEKSLKEAEKNVALLNKEIEEAVLRQGEAEAARNDFEDKRDFIDNDLDDKKDEMRELQILRSSRKEKASSLQKEIEATEREKQNAEKNLESLRQRLDNLINIDEASWKKRLEELGEELELLRVEALTAEENLKRSEVILDELKKDIEALKAEAEKSDKIIKAVDEETRRAEVSLASVSSYIEAAAAQYAEKFAEDIASQYLLYAETSADPKKIRNEIAALEDALEKLGPINLNALNDYKEAEERYGFLTSQRNDLEGSIADINAFIYETDDATVKMFQETFRAVKEKFVEVFRILFGDGEAELRLTDPDNPLTSGVEIYIQPPGKKLQHMGLLSGGEKALTAMTLLFALFLQKPTPFCFLDEVDAPLDDANVERYTGMVKALSGKTQFILITHNHNTMAAADSLYGVAMQEYGVSTVLSVKLEQAAQAGR